MRRPNVVPLAAVILLVWALPAGAQPNRGALIDQARDEFSDSVAVELYLSALDPALGPPDSLWTVAGFDLADRLFFLGQDSLAALWIHWIVRHGLEWPIDRNWYLATPTVLELYDRAVGAVEEAAEGPSTTTWRWPQAFDLTAPGSVEVSAPGQPASVTVAVEGEEPAEPSGSVSLPPGTYTLVVSAEGYEPARVVREILPSVTTVLEVELAPTLTSDVRIAVAENLVRVTYTIGGQEVCRNGLLSGPDGLVVTSLTSVQSGAPLRVSAVGDREVFSNAPVLTTDPGLGLAVLQLASGEAAPLPAALSLSGGEYAWSVYYPGCADLTSSRTRLGDWPPPVSSSGDLALPLPADAVGAPLVDRSGSLLGLVTGPTTFVPVARTDDLLAQARQDLAARVEQARETVTPAQISTGGKFPWKWVGAGLGVAGVAVALSSGGGGGGNGGGGGGEPTTGSIKIIWSGGG